MHAMKFRVPISEASRVTGYSVARLRELDDVLCPERGAGDARRYDPDRLEQFIASKRAAGAR